MDCHVLENAARHSDVRNRRGRGIVADDVERLKLANLALLQPPLQAGKAGIEPPIKPQQHVAVTANQRLFDLSGATGILIQRLFAKDMLVRADRFQRIVQMGVGRARDHDPADRRIGPDILDR